MKLAPRMRALSLILSLAILFSLVTPVSAVTEKKPALSSSTQQVNQIMSPSASEKLGGIEDIERREENVKHYILENGLYEGIVFPVPVHFKDPKDPKATWQDIDNSLESGSADGAEFYQNKSAAYKIQMAKKVKANDSSWLVKLNKNNYQVKWSVLKDESSVVLKSDQAIASSEETTASIQDASTKAEEDKKNGTVKMPKQQRSDTDKLYSSVTYAN